jgi:selT/selW/selH-like putative selenoprotein
VSKLIKKLFPDYTITGNKVSPRSGAFEVSISDKIIFSKFETGSFPTENDIKSWFN